MAIVIKKAAKIDDRVKTVNPVYGCSLNPPCPYCYMQSMNRRFHITPDFSVPTEMPQALEKFNTRIPTNFFFTSASDMADYTPEYRDIVFDTMLKYHRNSYLFLTKRPKKCNFDCTLANIWAGVTITSSGDKSRLQDIKNVCQANHYWVCFEPVLGDIGQINLDKVDWIVIGAETGNRVGKVVPQKDWIINIVNQAKKKGIPLYMKDSLFDIVGKDEFLQEFPTKDFN